MNVIPTRVLSQAWNTEIRSHLTPHTSQATSHLTVKALRVKAGPCYLDVLPLNTAGALGTGVAHVSHVVLMAVDLVVELVVGSLYHIAAHTATALGLLEMLLADWFVLKEQVCVSQRLLANIALQGKS